MNRRRRTRTSSLELLLDTICNTFGGVLFLAILVTVLLRTTSKLESASDYQGLTEVELLILRKKQIDTLAALESMRQAIAQQEILLDQFSQPENTRLIAEIKELRAERDELASQRLSALGRIAEDQANITRQQNELKNLDAAMATAEREVDEAAVSLRSEVKSRT